MTTDRMLIIVFLLLVALSVTALFYRSIVFESFTLITIEEDI